MARLPGISTASPIRGQIQNIENKFTGGLITEASGLNFPENACTAASNVVFDLIGTVRRRPGMDFEPGFVFHGQIETSTDTKNVFFWQNVQGDGGTNFVVVQVANILAFYNAGQGLPISPNFIGFITLVPNGSTSPSHGWCQFAAGYGYLFVVNTYMDPIYISYANGSFTVNTISLQIRDQAGITEPGVPANFRPPTLSIEHQYNLMNQGWTAGQAWTASSTTSNNVNTGGSYTFTVQTGLSSVTNGQSVQIIGLVPGGLFGQPTQVNVAQATVTSYTSGSGVLVLHVFNLQHAENLSSWTIVPIDTGYISTWLSAEGNYPSNADQWWVFKDSTDTFNPATTVPKNTLNAGQAPQGHFILNAFNQDRSSASGVAGLTTITATVRPSTVAWFQGRVWFSGVNAAVAATGDANYYSWTQNIYFSQIAVDANDTQVFGQCYQDEDPTSENLFDELPTDGGVIRIADCGQIVKLFPIQGALVVFATNGIWTITGNTGLGFTANDYSVNKLSSIHCLSGVSFVDVLGFPMWWTQEGIYTIRVDVTAGGLRVDSLTDTTIKTFYQPIAMFSKTFAVGYYNPLTFTVTYLYRAAAALTANDNFNYDSALLFNTITGSWSPWSFGSNVQVHGIIVNPYGLRTDITPNQVSYVTTFLCSYSANGIRHYTFSQTLDQTRWLDWFSFDSFGQDYLAMFECGYRVHGQGAKRFQSNYVFMYTKNEVASSYFFQGFWNFARGSLLSTLDYPSIVQGLIKDFLLESGSHILLENGGLIQIESSEVTAPTTSIQTVTHDGQASDYAWRKLKCRGNGMALNLLVSSVPGKPFHIAGWAIFETVNQGV